MVKISGKYNIFRCNAPVRSSYNGDFFAADDGAEEHQGAGHSSQQSSVGDNSDGYANYP